MRKISVLGILIFLWGDGIHKRGRKGKSGLFFPQKCFFFHFWTKIWQNISKSCSLGQNGNIWLFLVKMENLDHFRDQNSVIVQIFVVGRKYFSRKTFTKIISVRFITITLVISVINGGQFGQTRSFLVKMIKIG